jgi:DNA-binding SARP family transcriptional activator
VSAGRAVQVTLLDGFLLTLDRRRGAETTVEDLPRGVQRLVAQLGLSGRPGRSVIAGQLWPDVPEEHAYRNLRSALWRLQKAVPGLVEVSGSALSLARGVSVDVRELTAWAQRMLDPGIGPDGGVLADAGLQGELLPGWYDDWVLLERERLRQLRMCAFEALADKLGRAGRFGEAVQAAYAAVRAEPLRESAHRVLIRVHLAEGNTAEAVRAYEIFRALLADELGMAPTAQMRMLIRDVGQPRSDLRLSSCR